MREEPGKKKRALLGATRRKRELVFKLASTDFFAGCPDFSPQFFIFPGRR
jgi:hypothetical protein